MRSTPPAVEVTLAPGRREQGMVAAFYAVTFVLLGAWMASHGMVPAVIALPVAGLLGAWLGWKSLLPLHGTLRWDGRGWWLGTSGGAAHALHSVNLMIDLGGWMLLRAQAGPTPVSRVSGRWCGVASRDVGEGWHGLRLALYHWRGTPVPDSPDRTAG